MKLCKSLALPSVFLWIGFVCAISFMEAWLKFRAPGVTLPIGLGIGRLVFQALNKMEWIFAVTILIRFIVDHPIKINQSIVSFGSAFLILLIQTVWILPTLDYRAELQIQGLTAPHSNMHFYYIGFEILKVASLLILGIIFMQQVRFENSHK